MDITNSQVVTWLIALLGGGVSGALINWIRADRSEKRERQIRFIDDQIRKLYGPLYYLVLQSEKLFILSRKFHDFYKQEYIEKKWSVDENTQKILGEETTETLNIANEYIKIVEKNNIKIKELLDNSYAFLDRDDIETMALFYEDHVRLTTEKDNNGNIRIPFRIYKHVGDISFLRPEVIERIKDKFLSKKQQLDSLIKK